MSSPVLPRLDIGRPDYARVVVLACPRCSSASGASLGAVVLCARCLTEGVRVRMAPARPRSEGDS